MKKLWGFQPEAFGQHNNAEISSSLADTETLMQTMIEVRGGGGGAAGGDIGETVFATCNTLLEKLPENLDWEEVRDRNEADSSPLKVCLLQELELRTVAHWCRRLRDTTYCYQLCGHPSRYCKRASKAGAVHLVHLCRTYSLIDLLYSLLVVSRPGGD